MSKDIIMAFARNGDVASSGYMYSYSVDENKKVIINWAGYIEGAKKNTALCENAGEYKPPEKKIREALNDYIEKNGRKPFNIKMAYNCDQD